MPPLPIVDANTFKQKRYYEFEQNCWKILGMSGIDLRDIHANIGHDIIDLRDIHANIGHDMYAEFEENLSYAGPFFMRLSMQMAVAGYETAIHEHLIERELRFADRDERFESLRIGLTKQNIDLYYSTSVKREKQSRDKAVIINNQ